MHTSKNLPPKHNNDENNDNQSNDDYNGYDDSCECKTLFSNGGRLTERLRSYNMKKKQHRDNIICESFNIADRL